MASYYEPAAAIILVAGLLILSQPEVKEPMTTVNNKQIFASSVAADVVIQSPELPPALNVSAAVVKNISSNFYFFELNASRHWPLASLTKLVTAVVSLEELGYTPETKNLVEKMMTSSSNAAAEKLAEIYGDRQKFIEKLNSKVEQLGMADTSIFDPTGLLFTNQSTIKDLEKLVDYIIKNHPFIFQASRQTPSVNRFAGEPDFMGGKTGFTDEASGNLLSIFQYRGQPVLIIVLGAAGYEERFEQTKFLLQWISKSYK